jgi:hypothetical protein
MELPELMETIQFVNHLKHILWSIGSVGGNPAVYVTPNHELLRKLRSYIFETASNHNIALDDGTRQRSHFFEDVLSTDRFERRIRYCAIKLREFGISDEEHFDYISAALNITLEENTHGYKSPRRQVATTLQGLLVGKVAECFKGWYYPTEVQYYDVATEHQLAAFHYESQKWRLSSMDRYLLSLPSFEVIVFLCALEVILGRKGVGDRYLNSQSLSTLLLDTTESRLHMRDRVPRALYWFGIVDHEPSHQPAITGLGRSILRKVSDNLDGLKDTILLLTESEVSGVRFAEDPDLISQIRERTRRSPNVIEDQKNSIESAVNLFVTGRYLDSLQIFYRNIEAVLNHALTIRGLHPDDFRGMNGKVQRLKRDRVLSSKVGTCGEIIASRNKVVHGNLVEEDAELVKPIFYLIGTFWVMLIDELDGG